MIKKILIIIDNLGGGGAEKVLITLLQNISPEKYLVDLYLITKEGTYIKDVPDWVKLDYFFKIPKNKLGILFIKLFRRIFLYFPRLFYIFYIKTKYDVEIGFREGFSTNIVLSSNNKESYKISWLHTDIVSHHFWFLNKKKYIKRLNKIDKIICVSENTRKILIAQNLTLEEKTEVIYNPININEIKNLGEIGSPEMIRFNGIHFVTVGRLDDGKNHKFLIECVSKLHKEGFNIHLWIIGSGELDEYLKKKAETENIGQYVHFTGFVLNPYSYISQSDLFVFSSKYEGLPTVIVEAMALNKTIISTYCNGAEEILEMGRYGILCTHNIDNFISNVKIYLEQKTKFNIEKRLIDFDLDNQISKIERILDGK